MPRCKDEAHALFAKGLRRSTQEIDKQERPKPTPLREGASELERKSAEGLDKMAASMTNLTKNLLPVLGPAIMEEKLAGMQGEAGLAECKEWVAKGQKNFDEFIAEQKAKAGAK